MLVDALAGIVKKTVFTRAHGGGIAKYTHHESCILIGSGKSSHDIKYLCLYDNRFLRSFVGHADSTNSISMSPQDDTFITTSMDKTMRLWSLSTPNQVGKLKLPNTTIGESIHAAYDDSGLIFGVVSYIYLRESSPSPHATTTPHSVPPPN